MEKYHQNYRKKASKNGTKNGQKPTFILGHALACDTAVRVPVQLTMASPWHAPSHAFVLEFVGVYLNPP